MGIPYAKGGYKNNSYVLLSGLDRSFYYMKKMALLIAFFIGLSGAYAYNYSPRIMDNIKESQQISYLPITKSWSRDFEINGMLFTKYITVGSGGFSEYKNKKTNFDTNTTYEFIYNNNLYGYNMHMLKFFELQFKDNKFVPEEMDENQLREFFPDIEFVKVSQFENDKVIIKKPRFKSKTYMLLNDTKRDFYKYQFEDYNKENQIIHGIFEIEKPTRLIYSHFKSRDKMFPILEITVKNGIF